MRTATAILVLLLLTSAPPVHADPSREDDENLARGLCLYAYNGAALLEILIPDLRFEIDDGHYRNLDVDLVFSWPLGYNFYVDEGKHLLVTPFLELQITGASERRILGGVRLGWFGLFSDRSNGLSLELGGLAGDDGNGLMIGFAVTGDFDGHQHGTPNVSVGPLRRTIIADQPDRTDLAVVDFVLPFTRCNDDDDE